MQLTNVLKSDIWLIFLTGIKLYEQYCSLVTNQKSLNLNWLHPSGCYDLSVTQPASQHAAVSLVSGCQGDVSSATAKSQLRVAQLTTHGSTLIHLRSHIANWIGSKKTNTINFWLR